MKQVLTAAALVFLTAASPAAAASRTTGAGSGRAVNDRAVNPSQPDFTIIGLPTTLKMPRFASAFRVTHRFTRSLGAGDFGDLARDFFGFDAGAQIGLEYRFGIMAGTQIGIHRTSDRTIEFFAQHHLIGQGTSPVGIDIIAPRKAPTTSGTAIRRRSARCISRDAGPARRASTRIRSGSTTPTSCRPSRRRQQHVHRRRRRPAAGAANGVSGRRGGARGSATRPDSMYASFGDREARRRATASR